MEAHERIGVEPVAARPVTPVDQHDLGVGVRDQRVGEGHPRRTGSDDEVVGLDFPHPCRLRLLGRSHAVAEARRERELLAARVFRNVA